MKDKRIVPIIVTGIMGIGTAIISYCEIQRLKEIVSAQDEVIEKRKNESAAQAEAIESYKRVVAAKDVVIEKDKEYIEALEQIVEKDKEMIASQKEELTALQKNQHTAGSLGPEGNGLLRSEAPVNAPVQQKKGTKDNQEYIFQYDSELKVVGKYNSVTDACSSVGLKSETSITRVMKGKALSAGGYFWSRGTRPLEKFPEKWIAASQNKKK